MKKMQKYASRLFFQPETHTNKHIPTGRRANKRMLFSFERVKWLNKAVCLERLVLTIISVIFI